MSKRFRFEIVSTNGIVAYNIADFKQQVKEIKSNLQPGQKALVSRFIAGSITIVSAT